MKLSMQFKKRVFKYGLWRLRTLFINDTIWYIRYKVCWAYIINKNHCYYEFRSVCIINHQSILTTIFINEQIWYILRIFLPILMANSNIFTIIVQGFQTVFAKANDQFEQVREVKYLGILVDSKVMRRCHTTKLHAENRKCDVTCQVDRFLTSVQAWVLRRGVCYLNQYDTCHAEVLR